MEDEPVQPQDDRPRAATDRDRSNAAREWAAELGRRVAEGDATSVAALVLLLRSSDGLQAEAASDALWHLGPPVVPRVASALIDRG